MIRGFLNAERDYLEPVDGEPEVTYCTCCNEELYEGDKAYLSDDGDYFCHNMDCVRAYYEIELKEVQETTECENCGCRLLTGEMHYKTSDGDWICDDYQCTREFVGIVSKEVELEEWD